MDVSALLRPHREITKAKEGLGDQSRCRQGARKVGRWRLLAFPDNLTSVNGLTECLGWLPQQYRQALPEATSEYSEHFRTRGFWTNSPPSPVPLLSCKHCEPHQNCHSHKDWLRHGNWVAWLVENKPEKNSPSGPESAKSCQDRMGYTTVEQLFLKTL